MYVEPESVTAGTPSEDVNVTSEDAENASAGVGGPN